eukprot:5517519-Pleurochrysis_carterae.AAC.1
MARAAAKWRGFGASSFDGEDRSVSRKGRVAEEVEEGPEGVARAGGSCEDACACVCARSCVRVAGKLATPVAITMVGGWGAVRNEHAKLE